MSDFTNTDNLETLLIMAMESGEWKEKIFQGESNVRPDGMGKEVIETAKLARLPDRKPRSAYTFDYDEDRLYSTDIDLLLESPAVSIGTGKETILLHESTMKWSRYEIIRRPRRFISVGRVAAWVGCHYREIKANGDQDYIKDVFPVNHRGMVLPMKVEGWNIGQRSTLEQQNQMALCLSMIEDANRKGVLLAKASAESSIIFPIEYGAHKEFCALRDGPRQTPTGRKNPIIHFCKKHMRKKKEGESEVKTHWRGRDMVTMNGMTLEISTEGME